MKNTTEGQYKPEIIFVIRELLETQITFEKTMEGLYRYLSNVPKNSRTGWNGEHGESFKILIKALANLKNSLIKELVGSSHNVDTSKKPGELIQEFIKRLQESSQTSSAMEIKEFTNRLQTTLEKGLLANQLKSYQTIILGYEHYLLQLNKLFNSSGGYDANLVIPMLISANFSPVTQRLPRFPLLIGEMIKKTTSPSASTQLNLILNGFIHRTQVINEANRAEIRRRESIDALQKQLHDLSQKTVWFWNKTDVRKQTELLIRNFENFIHDELHPKKMKLFTALRNKTLVEIFQLLETVKSPSSNISEWRHKIVTIIRESLDIIKQDFKTQLKPDMPQAERQFGNSR
jgi:hypothetical protein